MKDNDGSDYNIESDIRGAVVNSSVNLEKITRLVDLFTLGDRVYSLEQLHFFDDLLEPLMAGLERAALEVLSQNIAQTKQAPPKLLKRFALNDHAPVAGPVLEFHPSLPDSILIEVAETRSDVHLRYLSRRADLPSTITTPLIVRGSEIVLSHVIDNETAELSAEGLNKLIERSAPVEKLAEKLAARSDLPYSVITRLVSLASTKVKLKLKQQVLARNLEIDAVLDSAHDVLNVKTFMKSRDFHSARKRVLHIKRGKSLSARELMYMIRHNDIDGTIVVLGGMADVSLDLVVKMLLDPQHLTIIALLRSLDFSWELVSEFMIFRQQETDLVTDNEVIKRMFNKLDVKLAKSIVDAKRYVATRKTN